MSKPEILAPAGTPQAMQAAVRAGADAVYFGAGAHNARLRTAGFCEKSDVFRAAEYCRIRGVRTYLTLNTLISDKEMSGALDILETACEAGIDAVIVQDLGLAALARKSAPGMPLHASTQMSVHTPSGVRLLAERGFSRVVLARELSHRELEAIAEAAREAGIELECFVHGALCMSVSGQCGISAALGSRSGNRGLCAGTCRLPFAGGRGEYSLSLKDLCLLPHIEELRALGIHSLKIEGRQKPPEYAAAASAVYKHAVEGTAEGTELALLESIFSRGFTDGYFTERTGAEMFGRRNNEDSREALSAAHELYRRERPSVPVRMRLELGHPTRLTVTDGCNEASATASAEPASPLSDTRPPSPLTPEIAAKSLSKTGGTPYHVTETELAGTERLSLPPSALNALRRQVLQDLTDKRGQYKPVAYAKANLDLPQRRAEGKSKLWARYQISSQYRRGADFSFVPPDSPDEFLKNTENIGVEIPRGLFSLDEYLSRRLRDIGEFGIRDALCHNLGAVYTARAAGMRIHFGFGMNLYNSYSFKVAQELGALSGTVSTELSRREIEAIAAPMDKQVMAYGHLPLMLTRNCPVSTGGCAQCPKTGALRDRKGEEFPVTCAFGCCEIHNPHALWTADRLPELRGADIFTLWFTSEAPEDCADIIRRYRAGAAAPTDKYTRGAYFR